MGGARDRQVLGEPLHDAEDDGLERVHGRRGILSLEGHNAGMARHEDVNVVGGELLPCSRDPLTGFYRDGCCATGPEDAGSHTVCAIVTEDFLRFSALAGNDLSTPRPAWGFPRAGGRATAGASARRAGSRPTTRAARRRSCSGRRTSWRRRSCRSSCWSRTRRSRARSTSPAARPPRRAGTRPAPRGCSGARRAIRARGRARARSPGRRCRASAGPRSRRGARRRRSGRRTSRASPSRR